MRTGWSKKKKKLSSTPQRRMSFSSKEDKHLFDQFMINSVGRAGILDQWEHKENVFF